MNFFKSVFSDDPDPPKGQEPAADPAPATAAAWDFGGLIKTITAKSESVIDTYRRDLQEFGSGLRKEIEVAQGSLDSVGHVFDDLGSSVLKGTAQIISQGKDVILAADSLIKSEVSDHGSAASGGTPGYKPYSRFEAQVRALQGDVGTYSEEPEDVEDYSSWKLGFDLGGKKGEIESLVEENGEMMGIYERLVPSKIDDGTFWLRYFYRVHKLEQAESLRANLVKRAITAEDEELSWDVYDDDEDDDKGVRLDVKDGNLSGVSKGEASRNGVMNQTSSAVDVADASVGSAGGKLDSEDADKEENARSLDGGTHIVVEPVKGNSIEENVNKEKEIDVRAKSSEQSNQNGASSTKFDSEQSDKGSNSMAVPSRSIASEEEDLGWDEIEDLSSIDDNSTMKVASQGANPSPSRVELRKRLSAAEEDEDLSWDIEDDDEPVKA